MSENLNPTTPEVLQEEPVTSEKAEDISAVNHVEEPQAEPCAPKPAEEDATAADENCETAPQASEAEPVATTDDVLEENAVPEAEKAERVEAEVPGEVTETECEERQEELEEREEEPASPREFKSKDDVIAYLKELAHSEKIVERSELESLKQTYYRLHNASIAQERELFIEQGGDASAFTPQADAEEGSFKAEMQLLKERRAKHYEEQERQKAQNLEDKRNILEGIKALVENPEDAGRSYDKFKQLQTQWKETGAVPPEETGTLWRNYQLYCEQFYDLLKLNSEFREYDFKKNLEIKTRLCEAAERLAEVKDPVSAFHQLQKLHQEFREAGPVAKDLRESVWTRFKTASTAVNKRHQAHFESLKADEEENLKKKEALCEKVEALNWQDLSTYAQWDKMTKQIIALQGEWKQVGFAPRKVNTKIYERFRTVCDKFFKEKTEHFKQLKPVLAENLAKKEALCQKAEELKENTEWNKTASELQKLQEEWKTIGPVQKKHSNAVWNRFIGACNAFYEARNKATAAQRSDETQNLAKKRALIEKLKALTAESGEDAREAVRECMSEWNEIGHIPFKYKDKVYQAYREQIDRLFQELDMRRGQARMENFRNRMRNAGGDAVSYEKDKLLRSFENKKNELLTYENNLGFLTSKSKSGNSLVEEMKRKMGKIQEELETIKQKIRSLDEEKNKAPENAGKGEETTSPAPQKDGEADAAPSSED